MEHVAGTLKLLLVLKDPFDRLIIAQVLHESLPVRSSDLVFAEYGVKNLFQVCVHPAVVMISAEEYARMRAPAGSLRDFLLTAPCSRLPAGTRGISSRNRSGWTGNTQDDAGPGKTDGSMSRYAPQNVKKRPQHDREDEARRQALFLPGGHVMPESGPEAVQRAPHVNSGGELPSPDTARRVSREKCYLVVLASVHGFSGILNPHVSGRRGKAVGDSPVFQDGCEYQQPCFAVTGHHEKCLVQRGKVPGPVVCNPVEPVGKKFAHTLIDRCRVVQVGKEMRLRCYVCCIHGRSEDAVHAPYQVRRAWIQGEESPPQKKEKRGTPGPAPSAGVRKHQETSSDFYDESAPGNTNCQDFVKKESINR